MSGADDPDHLAELFVAFGRVTVRRMFGGAGLFCDGMMFGLVDDGVIYLKADERTVPAYRREGLQPFSYDTKTGTHTLNSYWRMPERIYDDPEELAQWAREALESARRSAMQKSSVARPGAKRKPKRMRRKR